MDYRWNKQKMIEDIYLNIYPVLKCKRKKKAKEKRHWPNESISKILKSIYQRYSGLKTLHINLLLSMSHTCKCVCVSAWISASVSLPAGLADQQDQWWVKYPMSWYFDLTADSRRWLGGVEDVNFGDEGKEQEGGGRYGGWWEGKRWEETRCLREGESAAMQMERWEGATHKRDIKAPGNHCNGVFNPVTLGRVFR